MGKHPSMDWAAKDNAAQTADIHIATSVWWVGANHTPSCRGAYDIAPAMVIHSSDPMRFKRVSSSIRCSHCSSAATCH
jgi:hypothetical protein